MEYQHGGDIYSREIHMDYSANINPLGMPDCVKEELRRCLDSDSGICSLYPDSRCGKLRQALGTYHGLDESRIICGNGAADLIFGLAAALKPVRGLVTAPSFSEYEQALKTAGCRTGRFYLSSSDGFEPDMERMCGCVRRAYREGLPYSIVFLCNPNNPTGIPVRRKEVENLAEACRESGAVLVVDECFCDFLDNPEEYSVVSGLERFDNLFVLKAFTKLYAMAGLRLGYGLCSDENLLESLQAVRQPWSVSGLAQCAGVAALGQPDFVAKTRAVLGKERRWLEEALIGLGLKVFPSKANYLFFKDSGQDGACKKGLLYESLQKRGILIRSCANYPGLDASYYRICVKLRADNERLVQELGRILERRNQCQDQL